MKSRKIENSFEIIMDQARFLPTDLIISQIGLIVSRVNFIETADKKEVLEKVQSLPVASELKKAVHNLIEHDLFDTLRVKQGAVLINFLKSRLDSINETTIISAVSLSNDFKHKLSRKFSLDKKRLVFKVDSSIVGGVIINNNDEIFDYSISSNIKLLLKSYYSKHLNYE
jgi:F0F1-type ATP synthase delta subunit